MRVGKIGPRMQPARITMAQVTQARRLRNMPKVKTTQRAAMQVMSVVSQPLGRVRATIKRDPMNVSQNTERSVEAAPSFTPLFVINVVAQAATAASIGT